MWEMIELDVAFLLTEETDYNTFEMLWIDLGQGAPAYIGQ